EIFKLKTMEHLLFDGGSAPIVFSYAGGESWDGGDFQTYPVRKGWDVSIWDWSEGDADVDTHNLPLDALAAFLQSWLFFGLLETVLGVKVDSSEFLREVKDKGISRRVITTSKLDIYLENLRSDNARLSDQEKLQREDTIWDALSKAIYTDSRDHCIADSAGRSSLPKHTQSECVCPLLGPDMELVEEAIRNGNLPVVAIVLPQNDSDDVVFSLAEEELPDERLFIGRYFAISHVWNEGLGNPNANLLPSCQIKRIAGLMNNVKGTAEGKEIQMEDPEYTEYRLTVPFWMDTFCIPTGTYQVGEAIEQYPELEPDRKDPTEGTANGLIQTVMTRSMADACRTIVRSSVPPQISQDPERELRTMLRAMAHRNTSRQGDEAICISTYMDVDPTPLLAERPENRLPKLLHILPVLSKAILFAQGPRLQEPGLRWAPQTFLNPHGYMEDIRFATHYRPHGPGTDIRALPPPYLCPKGRGLVAFFSGIKLESQSSNSLAEHFTVRVSAEKTFLVDLDDTGDHSFTRSQICADASMEFAILFANERKIRSTANAMLVEWLGAAED
ncbi:MAG: hypothetical protein Q9205_007769, partial [Flavoplaca limonia]